MKRTILFIIILSVFIFSLPIITLGSDNIPSTLVKWKDINTKLGNSVTIKFNKDIDITTLNNSNIFVKDLSNDQIVETTIIYTNSKTITLRANTIWNDYCYLYILNNIKDIDGNNLKNSIMVKINPMYYLPEPLKG